MLVVGVVQCCLFCVCSVRIYLGHNDLAKSLKYVKVSDCTCSVLMLGVGEKLRPLCSICMSCRVEHIVKLGVCLRGAGTKKHDEGEGRVA